MELISIIQEELSQFNTQLNSKLIAPEILEFEERVRLLCFHCNRYNYKWTCPPKIPSINYKKMITQEYKNVLIVYCSMSYTKDSYNEVRNKSTNLVHKSLLHLEKTLFKLNQPMAVSFIGGSCKLCKNECAADKCRNPAMSRIPIEATGINVISSLAKVGVNIEFPVSDSISRFGLLLW